MSSVEIMLSGAVTVLTGTVTFLFKMIHDRLKDCEEDREDLWSQLAEIGISKPTKPTTTP